MKSVENDGSAGWGEPVTERTTLYINMKNSSRHGLCSVYIIWDRIDAIIHTWISRAPLLRRHVDVCMRVVRTLHADWRQRLFAAHDVI